MITAPYTIARIDTDAGATFRLTGPGLNGTKAYAGTDGGPDESRLCRGREGEGTREGINMKRDQTVHLGYAIGSGEPVEIPLAHTFVTGQTQLSGKTTALRAIVHRSGRRALAFVTKRGEEFEGRRIRPYLPREGDRPIHWRLVETILASALGQRSMKYERYWIVNAAKGAKSLEDVRRNVDRLHQKAKGQTQETYELIGEYLDLVLPEMRELNASHHLDLQPGLNVIDVSGHSAQLQALVIRACMETINHEWEHVLTVFPEAWEFAPRGRKTPASDEAVAMARKGAVLGNLLLCDSQDIAGVDTTVRQAASVWLLGVQRELNELKRTLAMIPAGIKKPKAQDITSLKLGEFIVCWGDNAIRTYVEPAWMSHQDAQRIATGQMMVEGAIPLKSDRTVKAPEPKEINEIEPSNEPDPPAPAEASTTESEDDMSKEDIEAMQKSIGELGDAVRTLTKTYRQALPASAPAPSKPHTGVAIDEDALYERFKSRLAIEAPALLKLLINVPELEVTVERKMVTADESSTLGMIAICYKDDFFKEGRTSTEVWKEIQRRWSFQGIAARAFEQLEKLTSMGFLTKEEQENKKATKYVAVPGMKVNVVKK